MRSKCPKDALGLVPNSSTFPPTVLTSPVLFADVPSGSIPGA